MFNWRLYRAAFVPFLFALLIAAFSLTPRALPLNSTLAPDAFSGAGALSLSDSLAREFPDRRAGSPGDEALAARISQLLEGLGGTAGGGFSVHTHRFRAQTIDGQRSLITVIAQRPGSTNASPIVILAHRDALAPGSRAEMSATGALLELASVFATRETRRTVVLVSTSGGSGGDAGAADFAANFNGPVDAAIVLGDLAGTQSRTPFVVPFSDGFGSAPIQLQRTLAAAISQETGSDPGAPSTIGQLAHLAFPFAGGEQGPLDASGLPAVLVQASGERGPTPAEAVSAERLQGFGRAVLSAVDALDTAPDVPHVQQTGLVIQRQVLPLWAVRLLVGALILGPLLVAVDALARLRRRREPVARWTLWTLACALPFLLCGLFAYLLGLIGAVPATPVLPTTTPVNASATRAVVAVALGLLLAWLLWPALVRRLGLSVRPSSEAAGLSMLLVLLGICIVVWAVDPFSALLLLPALHLLLLVVSPELRPRPVGALALLAVSLLPLVLLISFYAHQLGLGPFEVAWTGVLILAGGHVGVVGALLWSLALGCLVAGAMLALTPTAQLPGLGAGSPTEITIRGPRSYAGPGSLGGTESALRR